MTRPIQRIVIVNRGAAALRLIKAVRELNEEFGTRVRTIALFTEPDRTAIYVREADEAVTLGQAVVVDASMTGHSPYVDLGLLEHAMLEARADAAWVGWGFAAEDAGFAELCERLDIAFVGPSAALLRLLGDQSAAKRLARECHIAAGLSSSDADECHVEVPIVADGAGTVWALGVHDCSVRRLHQKVIEESASTALTPAQERRLKAAAVRLCHRAGYRGVGSVEFLVEPARGKISFIDVIPRLQAGHSLDEMTTGVDLVKLQLHIAQGGRLVGTAPVPRGWAIGTHLCAEDPDKEFAPARGTIAQYICPSGPGVRVESGIARGDAMPAEFDSNIATIAAWGRERGEALARLRRALAETTLVVEGGTTNRAFLLDLLSRPEMRDGSVGVGWVDRLDTGVSWARPGPEVALLAAAVEVDQSELSIDQRRFFASAARGRPKVRAAVGRVVEITLQGHQYRLDVRRLGPDCCRIALDGRHVDVETERLGMFERRITCLGETHRVLCVEEAGGYLVEVDGVQHHAGHTDGGVIRAPFPAVVVAMHVAPGSVISRGDVVAVLEAMKLEMPIVAPFSGRVSRVLVQSNVQVAAGDSLLRIEAASDDAPEDDGGVRVAPDERISLREASADDENPRRRRRQSLDVLRRLMLGYDVDAATATAALADQVAGWALGDSGDSGSRFLEDEVLSSFADVCALSRRRPEATDEITGSRRSDQEQLFAYLGTLDPDSLSAPFAENLRRALSHYGINTLARTPDLEDRLYWLVRSQQRASAQIPVVLSLLDRLDERAGDLAPSGTDDLRLLLDRVHAAARHRHPAVADLARDVRFRFFDRPLMDRAREAVFEEARAHLDSLEQHPNTRREEHMAALVECPQPVHHLLASRFPDATPAIRTVMLSVLTRRYYRTRNLHQVTTVEVDGRPVAIAEHVYHKVPVRVVTTFALVSELTQALSAMRPFLIDLPKGTEAMIDAYVWRADSDDQGDALARHLHAAIRAADLPAAARRVVVMVSEPWRGLGASPAHNFTFRRHGAGYREDLPYRGVHPMIAERLQLGRLRNFTVERLPSVEDVYVLRCVARANPGDERLYVVSEVRDITPVRDASGRVVGLPCLERMLAEGLAGIRAFQSHRAPGQRLQWNRVSLVVLPPLELELSEIRDIAARLAPDTEDLGLDRIDVEVTMRDADGRMRPIVLHLSHPTGADAVVMRVTKPSRKPLQPLDELTQKVVSMRRRGLTYPYEIITLLAPAADGTSGGSPPGDFVEYDIDADGRFVPVHRRFGQNSANLVAGVVRNYTDKHPEGMVRVILLGDPSRSLGALAEPECRRIIAALDLADGMKVPLEWFTLSSGARISMESGTENMDWIARVLRRLIDFTQSGSEVNLIIDGINVGAQPYWNAEATMLMHTRGILIMTPQGAMVLTGKQALEYSGGVSAEDNFGIGGYERIMGPNGQAQYWAADLVAACRILLSHYEHTYRAPGERFPRRAETRDPFDRDVCDEPHPQSSASDFSCIGDIFSEERNPGRKKPFDIRAVMSAVVDHDLRPLERWTDMEEAANAVVWDAHLGGHPVCLIGIESRPLTRSGIVPADGPDHWTPGTLFPQSSKKIARAINSASDNRPLVVLANLSGFDGSPESMRRLQLEFGAEIGRAVVNFRGPMAFCVISRYHGGAFVVFSATLNENLEVAAVEGSFASVIGGAPAAAVVFTREVESRTASDPRVVELAAAIEAATGSDKAALRARMSVMLERARNEKLGEVAAEFDSVHTVQRAQRMGSVHRIISARTLRPYLIDAVDRGMQRELAGAMVAVAGRSVTPGVEPVSVTVS